MFRFGQRHLMDDNVFGMVSPAPRDFTQPIGPDDGDDVRRKAAGHRPGEQFDDSPGFVSGFFKQFAFGRGSHRFVFMFRVVADQSRRKFNDLFMHRLTVLLNQNDLFVIGHSQDDDNATAIVTLDVLPFSYSRIKRRKSPSWRMIGRVSFFTVGFIRRLYPYLLFYDFNERGDGFGGEIEFDPGGLKEFGEWPGSSEERRVG